MTTKMDRPTLEAGIVTFRKRFCFIVCFCFVLQVGCNTISRRKREDPCPKLQVNTSHGCQPCSLCNQKPGPKDIRSGCQEKHRHLTFPGDRKLWCDNPKGPFPGCPKIPDAVRKRCTKDCKKYAQQYMAGCECLVGCDGGQHYPIQCSRDLQWNASLPFCAPTDSLTTTITPIHGTERTTTQLPVPGEKHSQTLVIVAAVMSTVLFVALGTGVAVCCWWSRRRRMSPHSSTSTSSVSSTPESDKSHYTTEALLPEKNEKAREMAEGFPEGSGTSMNGTDCAIMNESAGVLVECPPIHKQHLLGREQGHRHEKESLDVSFGPSLSSWEQEPPGKAKHQQEQGLKEEEESLDLSIGPTLCSLELESRDKTEEQPVAGHMSLRAMQALLNDHDALCKVTDFFDREYTIDKVTWHNLATDLAEWDRSKIPSMEYMLRPSTSDIPGDRPTYKVLIDLEQRAIGLQELITYLAHSKIKHQEAELFLRTFFETWKKNNIRGYSPNC